MLRTWKDEGLISWVPGLIQKSLRPKGIIGTHWAMSMSIFTQKDVEKADCDKIWTLDHNFKKRTNWQSLLFSPKYFSEKVHKKSGFFSLQTFKTFFHWMWFLDNQNTFYLMVKGLNDLYLIHFSSLCSWFHCCDCYYLQCTISLSGVGQNRVKNIFFVKKI